MKRRKTYLMYKRYLERVFSKRYRHSTATLKFKKRFNVTKQYADTICYKFYLDFFSKTEIKEWPIVNLSWNK